MKTLVTAARLLAAGLLVLASASAARAQVPAHAPGTICATPTFWCWAQVPGIVGTQCACATVNGSVIGVYA